MGKEASIFDFRFSIPQNMSNDVSLGFRRKCVRRRPLSVVMAKKEVELERMRENSLRRGVCTDEKEMAMGKWRHLW